MSQQFHDLWIHMLSAQPRCLYIFQTHIAKFLTWSRLGAPATSDLGANCFTRAARSGLTVTELHVKIGGYAGERKTSLAMEALWARLEAREVLSLRNVGNGTKLASLYPRGAGWTTCVPTACLAQGSNSEILFVVLRRLLFEHLVSVAKFDLKERFEVPRLTFNVQLVRSIAEHEIFRGDEASDGICVCRRDMSSYPTAKQIQLFFDLQHNPKLLLIRFKVDFAGFCPEDTFVTMGDGTLAGIGATAFSRHALIDGGKDCVPGVLNAALLCALVSQHTPRDSPKTSLAKLDEVLRLTMLMHTCFHGLEKYAGFSALAPLPAFGISSFLNLYRAAAYKFLRRQKVGIFQLDHSQHLQCDETQRNADYKRIARQASSRVRIGCLYPARWPADEKQMQQMGATFARHCSWARFFISPSDHHDVRPLSSLNEEFGGHEVINLASHFPLMTRDSSAPEQSKSWGTVHSERSLDKAFSGNTIQKVLLMLVFVGSRYLADADMFCRLDMDSAFVPENMVAFARAMGIQMTDAVYIATLNYFWKFTHGVFPDSGAGICLTRHALKALALTLHEAPFVDMPVEVPTSLASAPLDRCAYMQGHYDDVVLGQCLFLANVTAHPGIEDALGRVYLSQWPFPCRDHFDSAVLAEIDQPPIEKIRPRAYLREVSKAWSSDLHRFLVCQPPHLQRTPQHWISPFAFGFHGYKDLSRQKHVYDVIYNGATCDLLFDYNFELLA